MKKILLLFVLFLGLNVGAFASFSVSDAPVWKIFYNKDGTIDVVNDHKPCTRQYEENAEGGYDMIHKWCP